MNYVAGEIPPVGPGSDWEFGFFVLTVFLARCPGTDDVGIMLCVYDGMTC